MDKAGCQDGPEQKVLANSLQCWPYFDGEKMLGLNMQILQNL